MTNIALYLLYPQAPSSSRDITDLVQVKSFEMEERVNGAGVLELTLGDADLWARNALYPGQQIYAFLYDENGSWYPKMTFRGYIKPDLKPQQTRAGDNEMQLTVAGLYPPVQMNLARLRHPHGSIVFSSRGHPARAVAARLPPL